MLAELVIAHDERAVVRIGDAYIKADIDTERLDREVAGAWVGHRAAAEGSVAPKGHWPTQG